MIQSPLSGSLRTGILHLGLGAFHRAHQAAFTQDAIATSGGDWGIEAVSMRDPTLARLLAAQDCRYTLIEKHPHGPRFLEMTVIRGTYYLQEDPQTVAARMADPDIHIVTITVTEKGYGTDLEARRLNLTDKAVSSDLENPQARPRSLVGLLCMGLSMRRDAGCDGLTLMSCDNLPENGQLLTAVVLEFAEAVDAALADWIKENCTFPSSMVDRITPAPTAETFALAENALGRPDPVAVETEPFRQWIIQDRFAGPRPSWESAGAVIVEDVAPFEKMKLRMLNGAHSMIAYLGALLGMAAVRDVMARPHLVRLVRAHMDAAAETLDRLPGYETADYAQALIERFANPAIDHRCLQIAMDGSQKLPQRIFTPARILLDAGGNAETYAFTLAAWIRFAQGLDDTGRKLPFDDPLAGPIQSALTLAGNDPSAAISAMASINGLAHDGVLDNPGFRNATHRYLSIMNERGTDQAVRTCLAELDRS